MLKIAAIAQVDRNADLGWSIVTAEVVALKTVTRDYSRRHRSAETSLHWDDVKVGDLLLGTDHRACQTVPSNRGDANLPASLTRTAANEVLTGLHKSKCCADIVRLGGHPESRLKLVDSFCAPQAFRCLALVVEARRAFNGKANVLADHARSVLVLSGPESEAVAKTAAPTLTNEARVRTRSHCTCGELLQASVLDVGFNLEAALDFDGTRCDCFVVPVLAPLPNFTACGTYAAHH